MAHLDELIPLATAAQRLPNRPHVSALWRWCRLGVRGRGGERVRLQTTRIGMRLYTTEAWLADFGHRLDDADRSHFEGRDPDRSPRRRGGVPRSQHGTEQRLAAAAARLKEAGL